MDKVSLIVAAYNIEHYIAQCLTSCIQQTDQNIEIIVVDDCSTDHTYDIIKNFETEEKVIVIHHTQNKGLSEVRKTGYFAAQGKYVLFVDGDDWLELDAVKTLRTAADYLNTDILCFQFYLESPNDSTPYPLESFGPDDREDYLTRLFTGRIPPSIFSKFFQKSYFDDNQIVFPPPLNCGEDVALAASLGCYHPKSVLLQKTLYHYRITPDSLSAAPSACMLDILPATKFVETRLKSLNLYNMYKEKYEYYAFLHNLFYRFDAIFTIPNPYKEQLYKNWLSLHIHIAKNSYFLQNFSKPTPKNKLMKSLWESDSL